LPQFFLANSQNRRIYMMRGEITRKEDRMQRMLQESKEHQDLVNMMARHFASLGYRNIRADLPGMVAPEVILGTKQNHIPDLTADKNGTRIILEAETGGTISGDHTASQWSLFSDAAKKAGGEFHVVVPKRYRSSAERRLADLGLKADNIWTPA
jgi:hypothetical protein